jgi:hypothetical protein
MTIILIVITIIITIILIVITIIRMMIRIIIMVFFKKMGEYTLSPSLVSSRLPLQQFSHFSSDALQNFGISIDVGHQPADGHLGAARSWRYWGKICRIPRRPCYFQVKNPWVSGEVFMIFLKNLKPPVSRIRD